MAESARAPQQSILSSVLQRIPPFPAALASIVRACSAENVSASEIAHAISMEEVLAAKVVRAANATDLAPVHAIDNVSAAVARLGASSIRGIASAYYLTNSFSSAFNHAGLDREALWRHNLTVATASSGAAGSGRERANAYFAGLMHDVGKMILAAELGHVYAECIAEAQRTGDGLVEVERRRIGIDHADIGAEAAREWHFAPDIVEAIRRHHQVLGAGLLPRVAADVLVGNQIAREMGFTATAEHSGGNSAATLSNISAGIGTGIMSRARWALTNELPKIEAMLTGFTG